MVERRRARRRLIAPGLAVALLALPAAAGAETYFADDDGTSSTCLTAATACPTIQEAVNKAKADPGPDTVSIAAGEYEEQVSLDNSVPWNDADGTTLDGAGREATVIKVPPDVFGVGISVGFNDPVDDVTVRDLGVRVSAATVPDAAVGIRGRYGERLRLENVRVDDVAGAPDTSRVLINNVTATFDRVTVVKTGGFEPAVGFFPDASGNPRLSISRSELVGAGGGFGQALLVDPSAGNPVVNIHTSVVRKTGTGAPIQAIDANLMLDSTLVYGADYAVDLRGTDSFQDGALLNHATLDGDMHAVYVHNTSNQMLDVSVFDSILTRGPRADKEGAGDTWISCNSTDVPDDAVEFGGGQVNCDPASNGNQSSTRAQLFRTGTFELNSDSPAIDRGNSRPFEVDENENPFGWEDGSTVDVAGAPRVVDGARDCLVHSDLGAYELQGQAGARPQPAIAAPDVVAPGQPVTFKGSAAPAGQANTFSWSFGGGDTATGPSATRTFTSEGRRTVTLTVTGPAECGSATTSRTIDVRRAPAGGPGGGGGTTPPPDVDTTAPRLTSVSLARRSFVTRVRRGARRRRVGTAFRFTLSEPASVRIRIQRLTRGRRVGRRCRRPTRANRSRRRCTRRVSAGTLPLITAAPGRTTKRWRGRLAGRRLRPGRYRAVLVATDAAGNRSARRAARFRVRR